MIETRTITYYRPIKQKNVRESDIILEGTIGSAGGMCINSLSEDRGYGYYFIDGGKQDVRFLDVQSYDKSTRKLVMEASWYNGGAIGVFSGTLKNDGSGYKYTGVFSNYRGSRVDFNLSE